MNTESMKEGLSTGGSKAVKDYKRIQPHVEHLFKDSVFMETRQNRVKTFEQLVKASFVNSLLG